MVVIITFMAVSMPSAGRALAPWAVTSASRASKARNMALWRGFFRQHQRLAFLLVALALCVRAIVPQGYMFTPGNGTILVTLCSAQGSQMVALDIAPDAADHDGDHQDGTPAGAPCAFAGLGMVAAPGADIVLLALALAYVLALGFLPILVPWARAPTRLRPPLRAPPVLG